MPACSTILSSNSSSNRHRRFGTAALRSARRPVGQPSIPGRWTKGGSMFASLPVDPVATALLVVAAVYDRRGMRRILLSYVGGHRPPLQQRLVGSRSHDDDPFSGIFQNLHDLTGLELDVVGGSHRQVMRDPAFDVVCNRPHGTEKDDAAHRQKSESRLDDKAKTKSQSDRAWRMHPKGIYNRIDEPKDNNGNGARLAEGGRGSFTPSGSARSHRGKCDAGNATDTRLSSLIYLFDLHCLISAHQHSESFAPFCETV